MKQLLSTTLRLSGVMILLTGILYPALVLAAAQLFFPEQANGNLIKADAGEVIGSELIGQPFDDPSYFWGRPSATTLQPYNAAASSGSNLAPTNPALTELIGERVAHLQSFPPGPGADIPVDLVTASASGLDPHISPAAAYYQVPRVAAERDLDEQTLSDLVKKHIKPRFLGLFGEPRINVLRINLALDQLQ